MVNTWMVLKRKLLVSICGHKQSTELVAAKPAYESDQRRYIDVHLWIYLPLWSMRMKLPQSKTKRDPQT